MQLKRYQTRRSGAALPEAVEDGAVRVQPDHAVLDGDAVHEGLLVIEEVGVGHPQLVRHPIIQGEVEGDAQVGQPLVPPVLLEVHGQRVVLQRENCAQLALAILAR